MKPPHSPTPWHTDETGWVYDLNGETVVSHHPMTFIGKRKRANGILIATAPELLRFVRNVARPEFSVYIHDTEIARSIQEEAQKLVTKATYIA